MSRDKTKVIRTNIPGMSQQKYWCSNVNLVSGVDCFSVISNGGVWVSGEDLALLYQAVPLAYLGKHLERGLGGIIAYQQFSEHCSNGYCPD